MPAVGIGDGALADLNKLRAERPELLIAGSTHVVLNAMPQGYAVCTSVQRYFNDETTADLTLELDLMARLQLVNFMSAGTDVAENAVYSLRGFQRYVMWWEDDMLVGLYFVPVEGVQKVTQQQDEPVTKSPTAAEMILKGRELKKADKLQAAREMFQKIRQDFPLTPQARRALREIYLVETLLKNRRFKPAKETP
jgi:hypothetical protein